MPATNQLDLRNPLPTGTCAPLDCNQMTSVHGASPDDLWVVGYGGGRVELNQITAVLHERRINDDLPPGVRGINKAQGLDRSCRLPVDENLKGSGLSIFL